MNHASLPARRADPETVYRQHEEVLGIRDKAKKWHNRAEKSIKVMNQLINVNLVACAVSMVYDPLTYIGLYCLLPSTFIAIGVSMFCIHSRDKNNKLANDLYDKIGEV